MLFGCLLNIETRVIQCAFLVIGQDHHIRLRQTLSIGLLQAVVRDIGQIHFKIQPQSLLISTHHPQLGDCWMAIQRDESGIYVGFTENCT